MRRDTTMAMASATAERTEAVKDISETARTEERARVEGSGPSEEPRAWNAKAQID
jgi:hypothetical protein